MRPLKSKFEMEIISFFFFLKNIFFFFLHGTTINGALDAQL